MLLLTVKVGKINLLSMINEKEIIRYIMHTMIIIIINVKSFLQFQPFSSKNVVVTKRNFEYTLWDAQN